MFQMGLQLSCLIHHYDTIDPSMKMLLYFQEKGKTTQVPICLSRNVGKNSHVTEAVWLAVSLWGVIVNWKVSSGIDKQDANSLELKLNLFPSLESVLFMK